MSLHYIKTRSLLLQELALKVMNLLGQALDLLVEGVELAAVLNQRWQMRAAGVVVLGGHYVKVVEAPGRLG